MRAAVASQHTTRDLLPPIGLCRDGPACNSPAAVEPRANRTPVTPQATHNLFSAALSLSFPQPHEHEQHAEPLNAPLLHPHRTSVVSGDEHTVNSLPNSQKPDIRKQKAAENSPPSTKSTLSDWTVGRKLSENYFPRAWPWYDCT